MMLPIRPLIPLILFAAVAAGGREDAPLPAGSQPASVPAFRRTAGLQREAEGRFRFLRRNFDLDETQQKLLRDELDRRIPIAAQRLARIEAINAEHKRIMGLRQFRDRYKTLMAELNDLQRQQPFGVEELLAVLQPHLTPKQLEEGRVRMAANQQQVMQRELERYQRKQGVLAERDEGMVNVLGPSSPTSTKPAGLVGRSAATRTDRAATDGERAALMGITDGAAPAASSAPVDAHRVRGDESLKWESWIETVLSRHRKLPTSDERVKALCDEMARRARVYRTHYSQAWILLDEVKDADRAAAMRANLDGCLTALAVELDERLAALEQ